MMELGLYQAKTQLSAKFRMASDFDSDALGFENFWPTEAKATLVAESKLAYKTKPKRR